MLWMSFVRHKYVSRQNIIQRRGLSLLENLTGVKLVSRPKALRGSCFKCVVSNVEFVNSIWVYDDEQ